jgi:hypothetical protein
MMIQNFFTGFVGDCISGDDESRDQLRTGSNPPRVGIWDKVGVADGSVAE